jgi:nucleotide-binding universal stress UspA family protein
MFNTVIVGIDGSTGGRDAAALARVVGRQPLVLVGAFPNKAKPSGTSLSAHAETLRGDLERKVEAARDEAGVQAEVVVVPEPSPARALHREAEQRHADLIVVGADHHGRLGRTVSGDVSRSVLQDAPCAVAVAPRGYRERAPEQLRRIGVAYDGGQESRAAVDVARAWADETGATLVVALVWEPPPVRDVNAGTTVASVSNILGGSTGGYVSNMHTVQEDLREHAASRLDALMTQLPAGVERRLLCGASDHELSQLTSELDALVLGSRRWGSVRRTVRGSTSDYIVHHAESPVVVVHRPATKPGAGGEQKTATAASPA